MPVKLTPKEKAESEAKTIIKTIMPQPVVKNNTPEEIAAAEALRNVGKNETGKLGYVKVDGVWVKENQDYKDLKQQYDTVIKPRTESIQNQINELNAQNDRDKADKNYWINMDLQKKVEQRDAEVKQLREVAYPEALKNEEQAKQKLSTTSQYIDPAGNEIFDFEKYKTSGVDAEGLPIGYNPTTGKNDAVDYFGELTPDEWMDKIYNELMPTYSEKIKTESGPAVMDAYAKSLENQYGKDYKTVLENAAARGISTSGLTGQNLADLLATKNLNIQNKENSISDELQNYLESLAQSGYNTSVKNYSQTLMDEFKKSGQSWDQFYNENQNRINNDLNEQAAQTGIDFTKYQNETNNSNQEYLDQLSAITNLFSSVGNVAGRAVGSSNSSSSNVPVTQAVMSYYPTKTTGGISNNTLSDLSNTMNTNPKTGEVYDLYSVGKNWLKY